MAADRKPAPAAPARPRRRKSRLTRREAADMSTAEFAAAAGPSIRRLLSYVRPYKTRFFLGILFGVLFGLFNAVVIFGMKFTFEIVLPDGGEQVTIPMPENPQDARLQIGAVPSGVDPKTNPEAVIPLDDSALPAVREGESLVLTLPPAGAKSINLGPLGSYQLPRPRVGVGGGGSMWTVILVASIIPLLILGRGLLNYLNQYYMLWVGQRVLWDLRSNCFRILMEQSLRYYGKQKGGQLMQTVFNQTRMASSAGSDLAANMVKHPISMLAIVGTLFYLDPLFAFCSLVVFPLCLLPVLAISRRVRKAGGKEEQEAGMLMVIMQEAFAGIRVVKSHAREEHETNRFNSANSRLMKMMMRWRKAIILVAPLVETVASTGIAAGLVYAWATGMSATEFLILYAALIALYPHAKALSQLQVQLQKCLVAASKVFEILDRNPDIADAPDAVEMEKPAGHIRFENVSFSYKKGIPAVRRVELDFLPGRRYALVGQSGAGKSTLFSLLLRFYDCDHGRITIDGRDLREYTQRSLRDHIGVVNQDTFLFHDTIRANIRYGNLDATNEEIEQAARHAHAHDFILAQPNGYDTVIGDKGANISGGQQQRLTLARAFVRNAPILLLDEATSALDSESERHIQEALEVLSEGKTVIAIAHRLSTILSADAIVMMEEGRVVSVGTHDELLATCPEYGHLYRLQFHGGETSANGNEAPPAPPAPIAPIATPITSNQ